MHANVSSLGHGPSDCMKNLRAYEYIPFFICVKKISRNRSEPGMKRDWPSHASFVHMRIKVCMVFAKMKADDGDPD